MRAEVKAVAASLLLGCQRLHLGGNKLVDADLVAAAAAAAACDADCSGAAAAAAAAAAGASGRVLLPGQAHSQGVVAYGGEKFGTALVQTPLLAAALSAAATACTSQASWPALVLLVVRLLLPLLQEMALVLKPLAGVALRFVAQLLDLVVR